MMNEELFHEGVKDIQNSFWSLYKKFSETKNMKWYNEQAAIITKKYANTEFRAFCENIFISWAPIINQLKTM